ncbi:MAG: fibronectin type III domain-containing protein [Parcubacteria group bacterium]|jgi:hypothetical protein
MKSKIEMKTAKKQLVFLCMLLALFAFGAGQALAGSAHVTWNANSEGDLDGYKIYYDTASHSSATDPADDDYANSYDVTDNGVSHWFDALTPGQTYYFRLTAYDTSANESNYNATEVSKLITYRGDINIDRAVDVSDLGIIAGLFGQTIEHAADINRSGTVDVSDLSILAGEFGSSFE